MRTPLHFVRAMAALMLLAAITLTNCWEVEPDLMLSAREIDFGAEIEQATVTVKNDSKDNTLTSGVTPLDYRMKCDRSWVSISPASGRLGEEESITHTVAVDRSGLAYGDNLATIAVTSNGGNATITVRATRPYSTCSGAPSVPSTPSPQDGVSGVPLATSLSWENGESQCEELTATYDIYFGTTTPPPFRRNNGSLKSWDPGTLTANTVCYWRVVAKDANGSTTSATWSFSTADGTTCSVGPGALNSLSPAHEASNVSLDQDLSWGGGESQCPGLTATYDVYFGVSSPAPLHHNNGVDRLWDPGTLAPDVTYYWQVVAKDANGTRSSGERQFRTRACDESLTAPCNPSPPDAKRDVNPKTDLSWSCGVTSDEAAGCDQVVTYVVYLGTTESLDESERLGTTTSRSYKLATLAGRTKYYWMVVARSGETTTSSPVWSFTTH